MRLIAVIGVALLGAASGCGGPSEAEEREVAEQKAKAAAMQAAQKCRGQLGDFVSELSEMDSRLSVGLNYDDYTERIGDIKVVYDRIPFEQLKLSCLNRVGLHTEEAFNQYAEVAEAWQSCIAQLSCGDEFDAEAQRRWAKATGLIGRAQAGFVAIRTLDHASTDEVKQCLEDGGATEITIKNVGAGPIDAPMVFGFGPDGGQLGIILVDNPEVAEEAARYLKGDLETQIVGDGRALLVSDAEDADRELAESCVSQE